MVNEMDLKLIEMHSKIDIKLTTNMGSKKVYQLKSCHDPNLIYRLWHCRIVSVPNRYLTSIVVAQSSLLLSNDIILIVQFN